MTTSLITQTDYDSLNSLPAHLLSAEQKEGMRLYIEAQKSDDAEEAVPESQPDQESCDEKPTPENPETQPEDASVDVQMPVVVEASEDEQPTGDEQLTDKQAEAASELAEVMQRKEDVRNEMLPSIKDSKLAKAQLIFSVAESFAEDRTHTLAYNVPKAPEALKDQVNKLNGYLSFRSIITSDLSSREIKNQQASKHWATVCTAYSIASEKVVRNTAADKDLKVGSQVITYSDVLKYEHNPENFLGHVPLEFDTVSLEGLKTDIEKYPELDIAIDEARMAQKRWYVKHKKVVLEFAEDMLRHTPAALAKEQFKRYTLPLAIARLLGEDHFDNMLELVEALAKTTCTSTKKEFAEALRTALDKAQKLFGAPVTEIPSDTLIAELKELKQKYSRQTLPSAMKDIGLKRKQIIFFGTVVQGYDVKEIETALDPILSQAA